MFVVFGAGRWSDMPTDCAQFGLFGSRDDIAGQNCHRTEKAVSHCVCLMYCICVMYTFSVHFNRYM